MTGTIFTIIGLLIGVMVFVAGVYYLSKSKEDKESKKIYGITTIIGIVIIVALVIKIIVVGL